MHKSKVCPECGNQLDYANIEEIDARGNELARCPNCGLLMAYKRFKYEIIEVENDDDY